MGAPARAVETIAAYRQDFPRYAAACLKIRDKAGDIVPFVLNEPQRLIHERLEAQRERTGKVRAAILKGRQQGCSTYVGGRFYWRGTLWPGVRSFILTHRTDATANLFNMAKRFHMNCPALARPDTKASNAKELLFSRLDGGYSIGTAEAREVGRSNTFHLFHGSEVAFWSNAEEHLTGVFQAVPEQDGTEIILESTANGVGGVFYNLCHAALRGESDFQLIFVPWFLSPEYRAKAPAGWSPPPAWVEYRELHGLDAEQVYWAWSKNRDLMGSSGGDPEDIGWMFRQEYPATVEEAFQMSGVDAFVSPEMVTRARGFMAPLQDMAPLVFGVDCGRGVGKDKTVIIDRKGRCAGGLVYERLDGSPMETAGKLARLIDRHDPEMVFIDLGDVGAAIYDRLKEQGYGRVLRGVNFGGKPADARKWYNKRAEMWGGLRDWLADEGGAEIPDDDALQAEICAPGFKLSSNQQVVLEKKEDIRERLGFSPDGGDALALTFAEPVRHPANDIRRRTLYRTASTEGYNPHRFRV